MFVTKRKKRVGQETTAYYNPRSLCRAASNIEFMVLKVDFHLSYTKPDLVELVFLYLAKVCQAFRVTSKSSENL